MSPVVIKHKPTGRVTSFDKPSQAAQWLQQYKKAKLNEDDLEIDSPIHLSIYEQNVPLWAAELMYAVEKEYGTPDNRLIPKIHWTDKSYRKLTTGVMKYNRRTGKRTLFSISCGSDIADAKGVVLHELAHLICPNYEHHGREFYRTLFVLLRKYLTISEELSYMERQYNYIKSSRYWYAEYYNITEVLSQYRTVAVAAERLTEQQKTANALDKLFED